LAIASVSNAVATLSWRYFEKLINDLKWFLPYRDQGLLDRLICDPIA